MIEPRRARRSGRAVHQQRRQRRERARGRASPSRATRIRPPTSRWSPRSRSIAPTGTIRVERVTAAVDAGDVVNPDGLRNQIEGGIVQAASWTLSRRSRSIASAITSVDWRSYPIARFPEAPAIAVEVIERPEIRRSGPARRRRSRPRRRSRTRSSPRPARASATYRCGRSAFVRAFSSAVASLLTRHREHALQVVDRAGLTRCSSKPASRERRRSSPARSR